MRLVEQTLLAFHAGASEKVFEVDLCEVGPGRFVVNTRHGRRGDALKDGTRTVAPVPEDEARRIYERLVESKITAGYARSEAHLAPPEPPPPAVVAPPPVVAAPPPVVMPRPSGPSLTGDPRRRAVLARLERGEVSVTASRVRPLGSRVAVTRAPRNKSWRLDRAIWRTGELRLRDAVPRLSQMIGQGTMRDLCVAWALARCRDPLAIPALRQLAESATPHVARMATAGLVDVLPPAEVEALRARGRTGLAWAYALGDRAAVLAVVDEAALTPPTWRELRAVFKLAEMRDDAEVFGRLAWRFETTQANFDNRRRGAFVPDRTGRKRTYMGGPQLTAMLSSGNPTTAYGSKTRWYLRNRVWRRLFRAGRDNDPAYVRLAVGVLLPFRDEDARDGTLPFGSYWAFNHVMYGAGTRLHPTRKGFVGRGEATRREEPFGALWEAEPRALLHLLAESRCRPVHAFAVRILREQRAFCQTLPVPALQMLLGRPYEETARLGFELARDRYVPGADPGALAALGFAVAEAGFADLRAQAHGWIERGPAPFAADPGGLARMLTSVWADTRAFASRFLRGASLPSGPGPLIAEVARVLRAFGPDDSERAQDAVELLTARFAGSLRELSPPDVLALLAASCPPARVLGAHGLGSLSDAALLGEEDRLWDLLIHRDDALRAAVRPVVAGLAGRSDPFGERMLQRALAAMLRRLLPEGVPGFLVRVLREDFAARLPSVPEAVVWRLVRSNDSACQELGGMLLPAHLDPATVAIGELVALSHHEILALRTCAWTLFERAVPRVKGSIGEATGLLESPWDDSRRFGFRYFEERFAKEDFPPEVLVAICDSVRPDVQAYGRRLITRHFDAEHGPRFLLQLSEHPAQDVALFVTNYLEGFAAGQHARLERLEPYFHRVLCAVNRGRTARQRVHAFLRQEATRGEAEARIVARILGRQSASDAVEDREEAIVTLLAIHDRWPDIPTPLTVRAVEARP